MQIQRIIILLMQNLLQELLPHPVPKEFLLMEVHMGLHIMIIHTRMVILFMGMMCILLAEEEILWDIMQIFLSRLLILCLLQVQEETIILHLEQAMKFNIETSFLSVFLQMRLFFPRDIHLQIVI